MSYFTSVFGRQTNESKTESVASLIDEEILQLAESISESASVAVELSTEESPVTQSAFQTSFGQTTLVSFTTTGIIEPGGQTVIFLIQLPDDDRKRSINKREVGGFVGDGSPDTCTFASTFNLAQGQLFKNDNPIFYSGEDFKELVNQGMPPSDAITKGFASTGTSLTFQNDDLPNGQAGFCQTSDGQVYITFTSKPPGCTPITLGVHDGMPLRSMGVSHPCRLAHRKAYIQTAHPPSRSEATAIFPTETPAYATYCDSAEGYYDACSRAGVTAITTTLTTPTETETSEEGTCRAASLVKRAGEGLGYQFGDDWDVIRMPGWRNF
ncbi:uncharacterized protein LW93_4281 [Fusarium fujikuroi]|nr:uncharacterized protein LW93_4281 [Fusarium fujikuroi]